MGCEVEFQGFPAAVRGFFQARFTPDAPSVRSKADSNSFAGKGLSFVALRIRDRGDFDASRFLPFVSGVSQLTPLAVFAVSLRGGSVIRWSRMIIRGSFAMATERVNDLRAFHDFTAAKLSNGGAEMTLEDALALWEYENSPEEEREETLRAIQQGLDDMHAGRTRPFEEFDREFRARHDLPTRS